MSKCEHHNFHVQANINRLSKEEGGPITHYDAEMTIHCTDCGLPFEFIGLQCGMMPDRPTCNVNAQEARLPIKPKGSNLTAGIPGFMVRVQ